MMRAVRAGVGNLLSQIKDGAVTAKEEVMDPEKRAANAE